MLIGSRKEGSGPTIRLPLIASGAGVESCTAATRDEQQWRSRFGDVPFAISTLIVEDMAKDPERDLPAVRVGPIQMRLEKIPARDLVPRPRDDVVVEFDTPRFWSSEIIEQPAVRKENESDPFPSCVFNVPLRI